MNQFSSRMAIAAVMAATAGVVLSDARAQAAAPVRKAMPESSIKLPEYFGLYGVQNSGEAIVLDTPAQRLDEPPAVALPGDVEFLIYGKDVDPSTIHLLLVPAAQPPPQKKQQGDKPFSWDDWMQQTQVEGPANFMAAATGIPRGSREVKLLVKPVSNQPQMLRLIPAVQLPDSVYQIGTPEKTWYRFAIGAMPAQVSAPTETQGQSGRPLTPEEAGRAAAASMRQKAKPTVSLDAVCPKGRLGDFRHGTRCTGFYDESKNLVSIEKEGVVSSAKHSFTRKLVHAGVDIPSPEGSELYPIADGTVVDVVEADTDPAFSAIGYMVIMKHDGQIDGKDTYSLMGHMKQKPAVAVGQQVVAGKTVLGNVGATGRAFGPHVHFEIRHFADRFYPKWKNLYGKIEVGSGETPTFVQADFDANWVDPELLEYVQ